MVRAAMVGTVLGLTFAGGGALAGQDSGWRWEGRVWRWTGGIGVRFMGNSGEIGRQPNATGGHEDLIARLGPGISLMIQAGREFRFGGAELRIGWSGRAVEVRNEEGVRFPNHGEPPLGWTGSIMVYPLAPLQGRDESWFQPFVSIGGGGFMVRVDLDNIGGQTVYHSFQWTVAGGIRIVSGLPEFPFGSVTFVELRVDRQQAWANPPLGRFRIIGASVLLGARL